MVGESGRVVLCFAEQTPSSPSAGPAWRRGVRVGVVGVVEPVVPERAPGGGGVAGLVVGGWAVETPVLGAVLVCAVAGAVVVGVGVDAVGVLGVVLGADAAAGVVDASVVVAALGVLCVPADSLAPPQPASPMAPISIAAA